MNYFCNVVFQVAFILFVSNSFAFGSSSAPDKSKYEHAQSKWIPFEKEEKRDVAKHLYTADVVLVAVLDRIIFNRAGMGHMPIKFTQLKFKTMKVLKGEDPGKKIFRYTKSIETLKQHTRHPKLLVTLKKNVDSEYLVDEIFKASPENMSLVPSEGKE